MRPKTMVLTELMALPGFAEAVKYFMIFLLALIFLLILFFGYSQYFIPLLFTSIIILFIIGTKSYEKTDPILLIGVITLVFIGVYAIQRLPPLSPITQSMGISVAEVDPILAGLIFIILAFLVLIYIFRCSWLGICRR